MKITKRQLRKLIKESVDDGRPIEGEGDDMYREKFISLITAGDLASAEMLAESLGIDLFPMVAYNVNTVKAVLAPLLGDRKIEDYLYAVADGSFYEAAFFPTLLQSLQSFPSLCAGMKYDETIRLINGDPENYQYYADAEMGIGMTYQSSITDGRTMKHVGKDWLIAILFLKLEAMHKSGRYSSISEMLSMMSGK